MVPNMHTHETHIMEIFFFIFFNHGNENTYITANLRNQIFPGIPNPFKESGESLKLLSSKSNQTEPNLN